MPIGFHFSISGGFSASIDRAVALGCDAMQIFPGNPRGWAHGKVSEGEANAFRLRREAAGIRFVAVHTAYLINLSSPDNAAYDKSIGLFTAELEVAEQLGADCLVTHLGSPLTEGHDFAAERVSGALSLIGASGLGRKTMILLENTSGAGTGFGGALNAIGGIIRRVEAAYGLKTGLCFDTCHGFAAGYPLADEDDGAALVKTIDKEAGLKYLKLIHLNDSKGACGSHLDRHEHIGSGRIGLEPLKAFLTHPRIRALPLIMETPKDTESDDSVNLATVRKMLGR